MGRNVEYDEMKIPSNKLSEGFILHSTRFEVGPQVNDRSIQEFFF